MKALSRTGHLRRITSSVVTLVMMFSLVVMPGGATAAESSTGNPATIVAGGTNLSQFGNVAEASNGLNGDISIEVTGSLPTQSRLEAGYSGLTDGKTLYACGVRVFNKFKVVYGAQGQAAVATTITGLTATSTVGTLRTKIEAQVPNVATSIEGTAARLWLTARQYGRAAIAAVDVTSGVGPVIFGTGLAGQLDAFGNPLGTVTKGRTFTGGTGYDGAYFGGGSPLRAVVSFACVPSISYAVGDAKLGTIDSSGGFVAQTNDTGLYTAVKLPAGYDLELSTAAGAGLAHGTAHASVAGGDRDLMRPDFRITHAPDPVEVGQTTTITAQFAGMPFAGGAGGIDTVTFTLPDGFVPTGTGATAKVGATDANLVVDSGTRTITADGFFATDTDPLVVTLASQVPSVPGEYPVSGTYRNINDTATGTVTAFGKIEVVELDIDVTAAPALEGDTSYGHAKANGKDAVTFTVKTNVPKAGMVILAAPGSGSGVGSLNATSAVTNESGVATFTVKSGVPSLSGDLLRYGRWFKQFTFTVESDPTLWAPGFAHFYAPEITTTGVSKSVAFADGVDTIRYTFDVRDPVTKAAAPEGTRIYFVAGGWDRDDTDLSPTSALTDVNGQVFVDVSRDQMTSTSATGTNGLVWVAAQAHDDFSNVALNQGPPAGIPGVQFLDYIASCDETVTAQQSARGAVVNVDLVIRDSAGTAVELTRLTRFVESTSTDVLKTAPITAAVEGSVIHAGVQVLADDASVGRVIVAGDVVQAALAGSAVVVGDLGSENVIGFGVDLPINIVNEAEAQGRGSIYLGKANIAASNLAPGTPTIKAVQDSTTYVLTGTTIGVGLDGAALPQSFDIPVTMLEGTYDLVIDGITFPDALVVGDGIGIGVTPVVIQMGASRGIYPNYATPGSAVTLFGVVTTVGNSTIANEIVNVYSSATSDGANPTFIGCVLTSNGQFAYRIPTDKSRYYFATTEANALYLPGDSREPAGQALYIGVKTKASMKITYAPRTVRRNRNFSVRGTVPAHPNETTVVVRTYKLVGRRYVRKSTFSTSVPAGATSFARTIRLTSSGKWIVNVTHADYDHLASVSPNKAITAR